MDRHGFGCVPSSPSLGQVKLVLSASLRRSSVDEILAGIVNSSVAIGRSLGLRRSMKRMGGREFCKKPGDPNMNSTLEPMITYSDEPWGS